MAKFQCWTIRSNVCVCVFSFSYIIIFFFFFSQAFIKQSIPSRFIMFFFSSLCATSFVQFSSSSQWLDQILLSFSCTTSILVSGVCIDRFSLVSTWIWAWTFYVFIPSFLFSFFDSKRVIHFTVTFMFLFFHSFIHWLYCRRRQLSPFLNAIIFILRSPTIRGGFLFSKAFLTIVLRHGQKASPIQNDFRPIFSFIFLKIHNTSTVMLLVDCMVVCMSGYVQFSILQ